MPRPSSPVRAETATRSSAVLAPLLVSLVPLTASCACAGTSIPAAPSSPSPPRPTGAAAPARPPPWGVARREPLVENRPEWIRRYESVLASRRVTIDVSDAPLDDVIQLLRDASELEIVIASSIDAADISIDLTLRDARLGDALAIVLEMAGLTRTFANQTIVITEPRKTPDQVYLDIIDVQDLLARSQDFPGPTIQVGGGGVGAPAAHAPAGVHGERYAPIAEGGFADAAEAPVSTLAADVDTASYANVRRFVADGRLPPKDAVRIEELLNYFSYADAPPRGAAPFSVSAEVGACPWSPTHAIARIGIRGRELDRTGLPPRNLVFLVDVSGSMASSDKLPLLEAALKLLVDHLGERDTVALVVYAGAAGLVLPPTPGDRKDEIFRALAGLRAGGSTDGGSGIRLAYATARQAYVATGVNRVILATDGDFNVGVKDTDALQELIERERESGVELSVLGFGRGNLHDQNMERLADHGNGNYAYVDSLSEARKVLVEEAGATLVTIASDVKLQVAFDPTTVERYRLIGYENRLLARHEFDDDAVDAGEIGSGHSLTVLYEIVPRGVQDLAGTDARPAPAGRVPWAPTDLFSVQLRHKRPGERVSQLLAVPLARAPDDRLEATDDLRFATAVAAFGMVLRDSEHRGSATFEMARSLAENALGDDPGGYRRGFVRLVTAASMLPPEQEGSE